MDSPSVRRLTDYSTCGGCASKLAPGELADVLAELIVPPDPRVLIDYRTHDDAGVYRVDDRTTLVQTVDFFTPIVDDPYQYGQIAAANAISDVYAMGGRPITALAVAAFPSKDIERSVLHAIMRGGFDKLREAGVSLLGGHTVRDQEIKFGYAITGLVDPERVWSNAGARPGQRLLFTKALGTGIVSTAIKFGRAPQALADAAIAQMTRLNRAAAEALAPHAAALGGCTDVTGFSFLGHASEMAQASGVTLDIDAAAVPLLPDVEFLVEGNTTAGGAANRAHFGARVAMGHRVEPWRQTLLYDPQTSGGLLVSVDENEVERVRQALAEAGVACPIVGRVAPRGDALVRVNIDA
jgi:selenide,water dikinase